MDMGRYIIFTPCGTVRINRAREWRQRLHHGRVANEPTAVTYGVGSDNGGTGQQRHQSICIIRHRRFEHQVCQDVVDQLDIGDPEEG